MADRNLLFGILALQMDFITRDQLVAAMHAWVLAKDRPLGQVLAAMGALRDDEGDLLDALVQKHLRRHGNAERSLASVSSLRSVRHDLEQIADSELQDSLAHVSAAREEGADPWGTRTPSVGTPTSAGLRFRILRPHAKGGLGEVFVAHDAELHREVALKEIQGQHADHPESRSRFLLEAEITGGLEHPGIVPVYGLGTYANGRPFYVMRFIRGNSLHGAIERFHKAEVAGRDPGERSLALRQLLGRFVDVCDTIAYAHTRGVLHRDLKPHNVMLGRYGETLVVDWGLAKPVGRPAGKEGAEEGPLRPASASGLAPTQAGSVLGTPHFMPPEQAAGRLDQLGAASDVYGLGATLYCLLTGKVPFEGRDVGAVLQKVQRGDFPPPRHVKPDVPAALETVCLKAMALRPEGRYPSPHALKSDIECWLADEPVSAWREPLRVRAGRWARRHQAAVAAAAAGLLVALLAGGAGGWWLQQQREERRAEAARQEGALRQDVEARLGHAVGFRQDGHFGEGRDLLEEARRRLGDSGAADLRGRVEQALADTELVEQLDAARLRASTLVLGKFDVAGASQKYAAALADFGLGREGEDAAVVGARVRASAVRAEVVAALDAWAGITRRDRPRREWLLAVARAADPDPLRDRMRKPGLWEDKEAMVQVAREARVAELSPQLAAALGLALLRNEADSLPLLREAQARYPHDFWLNYTLGAALAKAEEWDGAIGYYRAALALRPRATALHHDLGVALYYKGRPDEAIAHHERALHSNPEDVEAHHNLGNALRAKGRTDEAIRHYEEALRIRTGYGPVHYVLAHNGLGLALRDKGRLDEAAAAYRKAIELGPQYAWPHNNLGDVLRAQGNVHDAIVEFRRAIELDPKDVEAHYNLGNALWGKGTVDEAIRHYEEALRIDPKHAAIRCKLGIALRDKGRLDEAIGHYGHALSLNPKDADAHNNLGNALRDKGRLDEAISHYGQALRLDPGFALAHYNLGNALWDKGKVDEAIRHYEEALRIDPKLAHAHNNLGVALRDKGRLDEAISHYGQALHLDPKHADAHNNLGLALVAKGRLDEAAGHYEEALRLDPKLALAHVNLGNALRDKGKVDEAVCHYEEALRIDPQRAQVQIEFGLALEDGGRLDEAAAAYRKAIALGPTLAWPHNNLGHVLLQKGQLEEAAAELGLAIALGPKLAMPHNNLGLVLSNQGRLDDAVAEYRKAIQLDPEYAQPHGSLGTALLRRGQFTESRESLQRCLKLLPAGHRYRGSVSKELRRCETMLDLEPKLPAILKDEAGPSAEQPGLADLCTLKKHYAAAARFYANTFAAQPGLADDLGAAHRYRAASCASRAAANQGADAELDEKERASQRRRALSWLQADLDLWGQRLGSGTPSLAAAVEKALRHWQRDKDLAGLRDPAALANLPDAERTEWQKLWADVAVLLEKAEARGKK
jgi:tetratricopeptide (TPR) repeat protein/serine/threonine protein kinase